MTGAPAPLLSAPEAPPPLGGVAEWLAGEGGVRLRTALFPVLPPNGLARGSVVLSPGRTESIEKYGETVDELRERGLAVLVHDWRGQGLSERLTADPLKGHGSSWRAYLGDFRRVLDAFETRLPKPWIALGHSMGGALTALALLEGEARFSGAVLSAPMTGVNLGAHPTWLARSLASAAVLSGRGADYAAGPGDPLGGAFETNTLTHDRTRWTRTVRLLEAHPELRLGNVTWEWLKFALDLSARLQAMPAGALSLPTAVVAAGKERLVDNAASRALAEKIPGARWLEIPDAYHELLMETDPIRAAFWAEFDAVAAQVLG